MCNIMNKLTLCDLHVHTNYSFDSSAEMERYAVAAIELGLAAICFTDHIDINSHRNTFATFRFDDRLREFQRVKSKYGGKITLLQGYEVGDPHLHPKETAFLRSLQPDMIIGSVHDSPLLDGIVSRREYERAYDKCVRIMAENGDYDVLGHVDVLRKWHADYVEDTDYVYETLRRCAKRGKAIEINTSSMHRDGVPPMPAPDAVAEFAAAGGKYVTVNSDSHSCGTLGFKCAEIAAALPQEVWRCYFVAGKAVPID